MSAEDQKNLIVRPPVVVVMGHIDHGKSTLLDYVRKTNIVAGEAGGITQHMGAYEVEHATSEGKKTRITFLDTPGHAAFTGIRARGAQAADIAILIISAEDGVKPQTTEALNVIKAAKLPYIVAITKIDKPNANVERTKQSLGEHEIYVEGWGGDIPCVPISSVTGAGINELLDMVMLVAELGHYTTDPSRSATGIIIESSLDNRKGISATALLKDGTLRIGEFIIAGGAYAPVRFIENFLGKKIEFATASMPVRIIGWTAIPWAGSEFVTVTNKKEAERIVTEFQEEEKGAKFKSAAAQIQPKKKKEKSGEAETEDVAEPEIVMMPVVIKADAQGSLDGVKFELSKITHDKVRIKIVSEGIGDINENDIKLAQGDPTIHILGFNAAPDKKSEALVERSPTPLIVKSFSIIYELVEYVRQELASRIPKEYVEEMTGRAKIMALFSKEKDRQVIGGKVETGVIESGNDVRIMRRDAEIGRGKIRELQTKKQRVNEIAEGHEFGMMCEAKVEIAPGDRIEAVRTVEKAS